MAPRPGEAAAHARDSQPATGRREGCRNNAERTLRHRALLRESSPTAVLEKRDLRGEASTDRDGAQGCARWCAALHD